jgi:hypothetical protein
MRNVGFSVFFETRLNRWLTDYNAYLRQIRLVNFLRFLEKRIFVWTDLIIRSKFYDAEYVYIFISSDAEDVTGTGWNYIIFFISIPPIPYSYGIEVFIFTLDLYTPWTSVRPVVRPLHHKHRINTHTHQTSMPYVGFERTITACERASEDSSCLRPLDYRDRPIT